MMGNQYIGPFIELLLTNNYFQEIENAIFKQYVMLIYEYTMDNNPEDYVSILDWDEIEGITKQELHALNSMWINKLCAINELKD